MKELSIKDVKRLLKVMIIGIVVFYVVSMPFRNFFALNDLTEVRPASALPTIYGLIFGFWGALAAAIANLICDIESGYPLYVLITGFIAQFLFGYIPYLLWYKVFKKKGEKASLPKMNKCNLILKYLLIITINNIIMSIELGLILNQLSFKYFFSLPTLTTFTNNMLFTTIIGIPFLIIYSAKVDKYFSINAKTILFGVGESILASVVVGIVVYLTGMKLNSDAISLWNQVFYLSTITFIILFIVSLVFVRYMEKEFTVPVENLSRIIKTNDKEEINKECAKYSYISSELKELISEIKK